MTAQSATAMTLLSLAAMLTMLGGCASLTQERGVEAVREMTAHYSR